MGDVGKVEWVSVSNCGHLQKSSINSSKRVLPQLRLQLIVVSTYPATLTLFSSYRHFFYIEYFWQSSFTWAASELSLAVVVVGLVNQPHLAYCHWESASQWSIQRSHIWRLRSSSSLERTHHHPSGQSMVYYWVKAKGWNLSLESRLSSSRSFPWIRTWED